MTDSSNHETLWPGHLTLWKSQDSNEFLLVVLNTSRKIPILLGRIAKWPNIPEPCPCVGFGYEQHVVITVNDWVPTDQRIARWQIYSVINPTSPHCWRSTIQRFYQGHHMEVSTSAPPHTCTNIQTKQKQKHDKEEEACTIGTLTLGKTLAYTCTHIRALSLLTLLVSL